MKYDAFISYRHAPLDMEMAKKVHTGLETYRIPKAVQKKTGKKKMGRVFRDQEELPIGSDLGDNISQALEGSKYLIVICSPRTPGSYWVSKEIETFIEMHDREHVLAVLIEGEPDESFPPQLLTDAEGDPVEPLAADVRGEDKKERNSKFKTEILRLLAPVIGCSYDDLKQRHRERMIKRTLAIVSSAALIIALAGAAFGIYNASVADRMKKLADEKAALADEKTRLADEISVQYEGKLENQSRFYAQEALSLLDAGNREDAALVAMEGLPSKDNERPYVAEAEYALSRALYAYDSGSTMSVDRNLHHELSIIDIDKTEDGKKLVVIDSGSRVYVWDTADWALLATIEPVVNGSNYYDRVKNADADDSGVYVATEDALYKYDYEGKLIYSVDSDDMIRECNVCEDAGKLYLIKWDSVLVLDPASGKVINTIDNTSGVKNLGDSRFYPDKDLFVYSHYDSDSPDSYITMINTADDSSKDVKLSGGYFLDLCLTQNGNLAVLSCNQDLLENGVNYTAVDLIDKDGGIRWTRELDVNVKYTMTFKSIIKAHKYPAEGKEQCDIVVAFEAEAFTIDEESGDLRISFNLSGDASLLALSTGNSWGRVGYSQGNIDVVDFAEGRIYSDYSIETADSVRDGVILENVIVFSSYKSPDAHVLAWHEAFDIEDYAEFEEKLLPCGAAKDCSYYAMRPSADYEKMLFFDKEGSLLYSFDKADFIRNYSLYDDKACILDNSCIWIIDPIKGQCEKADLSAFDPDISSGDGCFFDDGSACVYWDMSDIYLLDIKDRKCRAKVTAEKNVEKALLSKDGKSLYILEGDENLYVWDIKEEKKSEFKEDGLKAVSGGSDNIHMVLSPDGKYLALCCMDGFVRVLDTVSLEACAKIPLQTYLSAFLEFTDDGNYLVMQGDDYRIRIWDMKGQSFASTMDGYAMADYIVCDNDSGLMALATGYGLYLYETGSYGCVAYAQDGILYLQSDDSVLISHDGKTVKRCHYKTCSRLMKEVENQFPSASLSDEKRATYNIK